jgi:thiol-disulfide isomerase/thioredoxin
MKVLPSQEYLESLIVRKDSDKSPKDKYIIIYFSAKWCGPCKAMNIPELEKLRSDVVWYKCDVDDMEYTSIYCDVKTIPAFMGIINGKCTETMCKLSQSQISQWVTSLGK